jgi:hypothetical protein
MLSALQLADDLEIGLFTVNGYKKQIRQTVN